MTLVKLLNFSKFQVFSSARRDNDRINVKGAVVQIQ